MKLCEIALEVAKKEVGNEEIPRGSNWGPDVKKYLNSVGINFPAPWCMAFVYWCFSQAAERMAVKNQLVKTGGVMQHWNKAPKFRVVHPQPGDIFIMDYGKGLGHTGIVVKVNADSVETIEGNTNDEGSREGFEVCTRVRSKSRIKGYLRYI